MITTKVFSLNL